MATSPKINDRDHDLLKAIADNTYDNASGTGSPSLPSGAATEATLASVLSTVSSTVTVASLSYTTSASDTRPNDATPYQGLDVVSNATPTVLTFSSIGPYAANIIIIFASLEIDVAALPSGIGEFRLHLYNSQPTAIADGAAFDVPSGDRAKYLGFIPMPTPLDLGATLYTETEAMNYPIRKAVKLLNGDCYGILQTVNGYTPTALAVKKVTLSAIAA